MAYQLVLSELIRIDEKTRAVGTNVWFDNLPSDCKVYVLYYPGTSLNRDLAKKLRLLGKEAGKNLFVNIARLDDPNYNKIANKFDIRTFPTIIITAINSLASPPKEHTTAFVKIDDKRLLSSTDSAYTCVEEMYNLFIQEKIAEAIRELKGDVLMTRIKGIMNEALKGVRGYLKEWDISFSFITGMLELKHRGG